MRPAAQGIDEVSMLRNLHICSLPTEILYTILKSVLDDIVECDMITTPKPQHRVLLGGLPFPHTMALVCRHWRDIVLSAPGLWTRIFYVFDLDTQMTLSSQLEKTGSYPVDLTIISSRENCPDSDASVILSCIKQHIQRLRSLRIKSGFHEKPSSITLPAYAPLLECLHFESMWNYSDLRQLFSVRCPALRIFYIDRAQSIDLQWWKDNLTHVESLTVSNGYGYGDRLLQMLNSIPRRLPCLTLDYFLPLDMRTTGGKIGAEKVILCHRTAPLAMIDDHCKTIVLRRCRFPVETHTIPCSSTLELDRCFGYLYHNESINLKWDGGTVIVMNSDPSCIKAILACLGTTPTSSEGLSRFLWPNITTLKLVAKDKFVMKFSVKMLKDVVHSRLARDDALQRNLENDEEQGSGMESKSAKPITVLHVHGGPALSRQSRLWFRERVKDFVWDYKKS